MRNKLASKKVAIFEAALNLIAEHGFHDSPTSVIAKEAGIGIGTMYVYFESKRQLIHELFKYVDKTINREISKDLNVSRPVKDQIFRLCHNLSSFLFENIAMASFFDQYVHSPYGAETRMYYKHNKDAENIPRTALLYPYYKVFNKGKEQKLVKDLPNSLLFTMIYGSTSNFVRAVRIGIIDYTEELAVAVGNICWDIIKKD